MVRSFRAPFQRRRVNLVVLSLRGLIACDSKNKGEKMRLIEALKN
jgi:hypothetical protein